MTALTSYLTYQIYIVMLLHSVGLYNTLYLMF